VPFLSSIVLVVVGLYLRMRVDESPAFSEAKAAGEVERNPVTSMLRHSWRNLIRALLLRAAENAGYALGITYISSYIIDRELGERSTAVMAIAIAAGLGCVAVILWGHLSDKIGRRTIYLIVSAGMSLFAIPIFMMLNTGIVWVIIIVFLITFCFVENGLAAVQAPWFSELFPVATRASGISMAYQCAAVIGGFTPLLAVALYGSFGWMGPALLYAAFGLLGFFSALATPETWGRKRRTDVATRIAEFDAAESLAECRRPLERTATARDQRL
jgi:MFS transporter, MHS family, shikimate and dehydroshikimate transport protein